MRNSSLVVIRPVVVVAAAMVLASASGCGLVANLAYLIHGPTKVPAQFSGLEKKRVAVVCLDANSLGGPSGEATAIAKVVGVTLANKVSDIELVRQSEVADWIDTKGEEITDYRDIARGVKADMIVGIDLGSFSIHEGQTLLKGRARVGLKVYDMSKGGELVYDSPLSEISWPENGSRQITDNEANFRTVFIHTLAQKIAHHFYDYEQIEDFALDAAHLAN